MDPTLLHCKWLCDIAYLDWWERLRIKPEGPPSTVGYSVIICRFNFCFNKYFTPDFYAIVHCIANYTSLHNTLNSSAKTLHFNAQYIRSPVTPSCLPVHLHLCQIGHEDCVSGKFGLFSILISCPDRCPMMVHTAHLQTDRLVHCIRTQHICMQCLSYSVHSAVPYGKILLLLSTLTYMVTDAL